MAIPHDLPDAQRPCLAASHPGFAGQRPDAVARPPYQAAKRIAFGVVRGQAAVTLAAALAGWALGGRHVGVSAALGGAIGTLASLGMALLAFRGRSAPSAARILGAFYAGEMVKVAVAIVSFILVLKLTGAAPLPMFAAYLATFVVYWIVLARMALPSLARPGPDRAAAARRTGA